MTRASLACRGSRSLHTGSGSPVESTALGENIGSIEPGSRSSAGERPLHTRNVAGSIPAATTTPRPQINRRSTICMDLPGTVYFLQGELTGLIKIGIARDVGPRVRALQNGSPDKLIIIGTVCCAKPRYCEMVMHRMFAAARSHGEWFRPTDDLLAALGEVLETGDFLSLLARH